MARRKPLYGTFGIQYTGIRLGQGPFFGACCHRCFGDGEAKPNLGIGISSVDRLTGPRTPGVDRYSFNGKRRVVVDIE